MLLAPELAICNTPEAHVQPVSERGWRLSLPVGPAGRYRWAQLDDYRALPRSRLHWTPPLALRLRARVSAPDLPGTWGFGLWNDPFQASLGLGGAARRLPALPAAVWFFYGSPPNFLTLRDDGPGHGLLAASYASARVPPAALLPALAAAPLLAWPLAARWVRHLARRWVHDDARRLELDTTAWHLYELDWWPNAVRFRVDGRLCHASRVAPHGPLGLVLWLDNQYAAFPPDGRVRLGTLACAEPAWLELDDIQLVSL